MYFLIAIFVYSIHISNLQANSAVVTNTNPIIDLAEIVVTGNFEQEVIERAEIEASGAQHLGELLQGRAGLDVRNAAGNPTRAVIDMGGFGAVAGSNTLVLLNGVKLNNSSDLAPPDLSNVDLGAVEKIEIIRGNSSILYGNQAVGGVVNIVTRTPQRSGVTMQTGVGSFDSYALRSQITQLYVNSGTVAQLNVNKQENNLDRNQSHSRHNATSAALTQNYSSGSIILEQQMQWENTQLPGALFAEEIAANRHQSVAAYQGDFSKVATHITRFNWQQDLDNAWNLLANLSYRDNDGRFQLSGRSWAGNPSTQERQIIQFTPKISGPLPMAGIDFNLTVGSEVETVDYQLNTAFGLQSETQDNYAIYIQLAAALGENWSATLGWRYAEVQNRIRNNANYDLNDAFNVGSVNFTYEPVVNWRLAANWEQNYRFATVDEHTNVITGQTVGIKNQTGESYTLSAAYQRSDLNLRIQQYWLYLNNEIGFDSTTFFNINLPRTQRNGTFFELTWQLNHSWHFGADYTFTHNNITSGPFAERDLPLVPRHSGRLVMNYLLNHATELQLTSRWIGKRILGGDFANNFNPIPGYGIVDVSARYRTGPWKFIAKLENLLDHQYNADGAVGYDAAFNVRAAYFPAAGRSAWITCTYEY